MGRRKKEIPAETLRALAMSGKTQKEMAQDLGISIPTLARRMGTLRAMEGPLQNYREVMGLHLTALQAKVLEAITPEKIAQASLLELVKAVKILIDKHESISSEKLQMKGFLGYLIELEKEGAA